MKKVLVSLSLLLALITSSALPADQYLRQARDYGQQGYQAAVRGKNKVQHLWFCFRNPSQCSQAEFEQAKKWIYGTATGAVLAALLATGIVIGKNKLEEIKNQRIIEEYKNLVKEKDTLEEPYRENVGIRQAKQDFSKLDKNSKYQQINERLKELDSLIQNIKPSKPKPVKI